MFKVENKLVLALISAVNLNLREEVIQWSLVSKSTIIPHPRCTFVWPCLSFQHSSVDCTVSTTVMCVGHCLKVMFCPSLQDLCQLVNADAPYWLVGMTEMTRTFGLELLESVLNDFPGVFLQVHAALHVMANLVSTLQLFTDSTSSNTRKL